MRGFSLCFAAQIETMFDSFQTFHDSVNGSLLAGAGFIADRIDAPANMPKALQNKIFTAFTITAVL